MNKKAVLYKGIYLMPQSHALQLYEEKKLAALDKHLKQLQENERKLMERKD